jgi:CubicO group peptidase (beta-lactamase class C family)
MDSGIAALLEPVVRNSVERCGLPGIAVVVNRRGSELFATGLGQRDPAGREPIDADTMFGVASLTKFVTAVALLRLEERGNLSIDDRVSQYFPALRLASLQPMQLGHLLSHSAGFPALPGRFHARNRAKEDDISGGIGMADTAGAVTAQAAQAQIETADELVDLINGLDVKLLAAPGQLLNYCNEGYCLLGGVIEGAAGAPYAQHVERAVVAPLGMTRTTIGAAHLQGFANVASHLQREGDAWIDAGVWDAPLFYPAGGVITSARDLVRLISVLDDGHALLAPQSREQLRRCRIGVASRPDPGIGYGLGLEHHRVGADFTLLWHSGQRAGVSSFVGWLEQERLAVAVLCNVADAPAASIGHELISKLLGRDDIAWPRRKPPVEISAREASRFVGRYGSAEKFDYSVEAHAGGLRLTGRAGSDAFRFTDRDSGTVGDQTFRFLADGDAPAGALALDLRIVQRK